MKLNGIEKKEQKRRRNGVKENSERKQKKQKKSCTCDAAGQKELFCDLSSVFPKK